MIRLTADDLRQLQTHAPAAPACRCGVGACDGWVSLSPERWPTAQMQAIGTLRDMAVHEPSFEELHPHGTRYESPAAPVAPHFYPYNRCDLYRCTGCQRLLLRYTEAGGYYVDERVRVLAPGLPVLDDAAS